MKVIKQFDIILKDLDLDNFPDKGIHIPDSDYGLANIYLNEGGGYILEEIPMYGGEPSPHFFSTAEALLKELKSWT